MEMQQYIDNMVKAGRAETLARSDQLTIGELILKLESVKPTYISGLDKKETVKLVVFDFEYLFPVSIDSWRGSYSELALSFSSKDESKDNPISIREWIEILKSCIGKTFEGYKGGDYIMSKHTPVWVANYGNSGNTGVVEVVDQGYKVILITGYCEY